MGAAPVGADDEHTISFGGGSYARFDGTPMVRTDLRELVLFGELRRHLSSSQPGGLVLAGSLTFAPALAISEEQLSPADAGSYDAPTTQQGEFALSGQASARVGWHGDHLGGEAGAALVRDDALLAFGGMGILALAPSAVAWAGWPALHAFGQLHRGPLALSGPVAGLGHHSGALDLAIAALPPQGERELVWMAEFQASVTPGVKLGLSAGGDERESRRNVRGMVVATIDHGAR